MDKQIPKGALVVWAGVPVSVNGSGSDLRAVFCVGGFRERERDATRDLRYVPWGFYERIQHASNCLGTVDK